MPSRTQSWRRELDLTPAVPVKESWVDCLNESLADQIRLLTQQRQAAYGQAATHRREGHLVPGSLSQELTENASELRGALDRYAEAVSGRERCV